jgi:hypothetical protein
MQSNITKPTTNSPVQDRKQNSIKEAVLTEIGSVAKKTEDNNPKSPQTGDKGSRFKHFIRVKIGGDPTGILPTAVENKVDATVADAQPLATSFTRDKKVDGTANDQKQKAQELNPNVVVPDFLKNPVGNTATQSSVSTNNTAQKTDSSKASDATNISVNPQNKSSTVSQVNSSSTTAQATSSNKENPETPRELIFDSRLGQIVGRSEVRLSTTNHSMVKVTIVDPTGEYRAQIPKLKNAEVSIGFVNGREKNVFVGVVRDVGITRFGTLVELIDPSAQMQGATSAVTETADPPAASQAITGTTPAPISTAATPQAIAAAGTATTASQQVSKTNPATGSVTTQSTLKPALATATSTTKPTTTDQTQAALSANEKDILTQIQSTGLSTKSGSLAKSFIESAGQAHGLKFSDQTSGLGIHKMGHAHLQQSLMEAAVRDAALKGNVIVTRGNTVTEVSPGNAPSSGVILDYASNPGAFMGRPTIKKRLPVQLQGNAGGVMIRGWNPATKQEVLGVAYTPGQPMQHPTGIIQPPEWSSIKLSDPIVPGSMYTWADATRNGERVPEGKDIIQAFIRIATILTKFTNEVGKGKWKINSWYRPRSINARIPGAAKDSRHIYGDAVDVFFDGCWQFHRRLYDSWSGGLAIKPGVFVHLDDRGSAGRGKSRWTYK